MKAINKILVILIFLTLAACGQHQQKIQDDSTETADALNDEKNDDRTDLIRDIQGRWEVLKYNGETKAADKAGHIDFLQDGTFISADIYLGHTEGLYRTDENQSVLIIEVEGELTEWSVTRNEDNLRLEKIVDQKQPSVYLVLRQIDHSG